MKFKEYKYFIYSSLYRYRKKFTFLVLIKELIIGEGFKYIFWMRTLNYIISVPILKILFYIPVKFILRRQTYKFGISIPANANIGPGFFIGHFGTIIVHEKTIIGSNCNISQGVTLGRSNRGEKKGSPVLGDNVYIGPGVKIIGNVKIGNNVAVGANSVVTKDIENDSVVVGVPGKVISKKGSFGYINNTDYDSQFKNDGMLL